MDWSVYNLVDEFTLHDAGFLLCGLDPLPFCYKLPDNDPYLRERQKASILTNALIVDAKQGRLKVQNSEGEDAVQVWNRLVSAQINRPNSIYTELGLPSPARRLTTILSKGYFHHWLVHRDDLKAWTESKNMRPPFLFSESRVNAGLHHAQNSHVNGSAHMVTPQKWNTLDQAAVWLSGKTDEEWTIERIIGFSISQCKPDDIVEDYKYPSYLRSTIPHEIKELCDPYIAPHVDNPREYGYLFQSIKTGSDKVSITFLFKRNLEEIQADGRSRLLYVEYDNPAMPDSNLCPVIAYYDSISWGPRVILLDGPSPQFPLPPCIEINHKTIGIRDEELKQLLRDYLALPEQTQSKLLPDERQAQKEKREEGVFTDQVNYLEIKERIFPMDELIEKAIEETDNDTTNAVFLKLKEYAEQRIPPHPLTGGQGAMHVEYEKNSREKADYTKNALRGYLKRRKEAIEKCSAS